MWQGEIACFCLYSTWTLLLFVMRCCFFFALVLLLVCLLWIFELLVKCWFGSLLFVLKRLLLVLFIWIRFWFVWFACIGFDTCRLCFICNWTYVFDFLVVMLLLFVFSGQVYVSGYTDFFSGYVCLLMVVLCCLACCTLLWCWVCCIQFE